MACLRLFLLIITIFLFSACKVGKKAPVRNHEAPIPTIQDNSKTEQERLKTDTDSEISGNIDLEKIYERSKQSNVNTLEEVLNPLSHLLFSSKIRLNQAVNRTDQIKWALKFFNSSLINFVSTKKNFSEVDAILQRYQNLALEGCDVDSIKNCINFFFLKQDTNSSQVVKMLAMRETKIKPYYRLLTLAYELSGKRTDAELTRLMEARAIELLKVYVVEQKRADGALILSISHLNSKQGLEYRFYTNLLATILHTADQKTKVEGFKSGAKTLMSWIASPTYTQVMGVSLANELNLLISDWIKSPDLWNGLVKRMDQWEQQELSYSGSLKNIPKKMISRFNLNSINLNALTQDQPRSRIGFFYLSRIFGMQSSQQERYLWNLSDQNRKATVGQIQALVRAAFMSNVFNSHRIMAKTFKRFESEFLAKSKILSKTIEEAERQLAPEWASFFAQSTRLESFFTNEIETAAKQSSDPEFIKMVKETRSMFSDLNNNVKTMVTYPIMTVFAYYAAKWDYLETIPTPDGKAIEINKRVYMNELFAGKIPPLFVLTNYTGDDKSRNFTALSKVEFMTAMHYFLKTEVLAEYGVNLADFLSEITLTFKVPNDATMNTKITEMQNLVIPNSPYSELIKFCALIDSETPEVKKRLDLEPASIFKRTFLGIPGDYEAGEPLRSFAKKIQYGGYREGRQGLDDAIETMRSDIDPKLRWLSFFKGIISELSDIKGQAESLKLIDAETKASSDLKDQLLKLTESYVSNSTNCSLRMAEVELERQKQLTQMEVDFASDVFDLLEILEGLGDQGTQTVARLERLDPNFRLFTDIRFKNLNPDLPVYKAFNQWLVEKTNLADAFRAMPYYSADYNLSGGIQRDRNGKYYFNHRSRDFTVRTVEFLKYGYNSSRISPKPDDTIVIWPISKDIKNLDGPTHAGKVSPVYLGQAKRREIRLADFKFSFTSLILQRTNWFGNIRSLSQFLRYTLKNEAALFKYQFQRDLEIEKISQCDENCQNEVKNSAKESTARIIELNNRMIKIFAIDESHEQFLRLIGEDTNFMVGLTSAYQPHGPADLYISSGIEGTYLGALDDFYMYVTAPLLGYLPVFLSIRSQTAQAAFILNNNDGYSDRLFNNRSSYYYEASNSYTSLRDLNRDVLFPLGEKNKSMIQSFNGYILNREMLIAAGVEEAAMDWSSQGKPVQFMHFSLSKPRLERPHLLSPEIIAAYYEVQRLFNQQTGGFYLPEILRNDRRWFEGL